MAKRTSNRLLDSFVPDVPISYLKPAKYNPRKIAEDSLERLVKSIGSIGFAKPVIYLPDGLLLAGHQRTKAAVTLGLETCPGYMLEGVSEGDQIRFNQMHNGTDLDKINHPVFVPPCEVTGEFVMVDGKDVKCNARSSGAPIRGNLSQLIDKYGAWGSCVATTSGRVVACPHYAIVCKILGIPLRTYYIQDQVQEEAEHLLTSQYGQFSYDHLPRETFRQTFAQPARLRSGEKNKHGCQGRSVLYTEYLLPRITRKTRVLDFGCGFADWFTSMRKKGYDVLGIEFFFRESKSPKIATGKVHEMIDNALREWRERGPFDVVIADSVLNSVDSDQAEKDVITCLNAFCKVGGQIIFSGRSREVNKYMEHATSAASTCNSTKRAAEYYDENGYSGIFLNGGWFYQKFHTREQIEALEPWFPGSKLHYSVKSSYWFAEVVRQDPLPLEIIEGALRREFDLMWPEGRSVGRAEQAIGALKYVVATHPDKFYRAHCQDPCADSE